MMPKPNTELPKKRGKRNKYDELLEQIPPGKHITVADPKEKEKVRYAVINRHRIGKFLDYDVWEQGNVTYVVHNSNT